ncbi:jg27884 [Pararge aegeria aegeria]|uniref:Jg27884 protein n=1 Tax=Pararge aegeria aegeria TaxID=348720 RepID=A0A8S4QP76_9NEOP|nr:jg27884 [Pararge aegeria aegeria]
MSQVALQLGTKFKLSVTASAMLSQRSVCRGVAGCGGTSGCPPACRTCRRRRSRSRRADAGGAGAARARLRPLATL